MSKYYIYNLAIFVREVGERLKSGLLIKLGNKIKSKIEVKK